MKLVKLFLIISTMSMVNISQASEPSIHHSDKACFLAKTMTDESEDSGSWRRLSNTLCDLAADSPQIGHIDDKIVGQERTQLKAKLTLLERRYDHLASMEHGLRVIEFWLALTRKNNYGKTCIDVAKEQLHKSLFTHTLINTWEKQEKGLIWLIAQGKGSAMLTDIDRQEMKNAINQSNGLSVD